MPKQPFGPQTPDWEDDRSLWWDEALDAVERIVGFQGGQRPAARFFNLNPYHVHQAVRHGRLTDKMVKALINQGMKPPPPTAWRWSAHVSGPAEQQLYSDTARDLGLSNGQFLAMLYEFWREGCEDGETNQEQESLLR